MKHWMGIYVMVVLVSLMSTSEAVQVTITGSGTVSAGLLFDAAATVYTKTVNPEVQVLYTSTDSISGQNSVIDGDSLFSGSDIPLTEEQYSMVPDLQLMPLVVVGIVPYTSSFSGLILTGETLAQIYMGKITQWNHPNITSLNPSISFSEIDIKVIYESESTGETSVFTRALSGFSEEWDNLYGTFDTWPEELTSLDNFLPATGDTGGFTFSNLTPFSISYLTYGFAFRQGASDFTVRLVNNENRVVQCSIDTISLALGGAEFDERGNSDLTNPPNPDAWPISAFTYIILRTSSTAINRCNELTEFARYLLYGAFSSTTAILLEANGYSGLSGEAGGIFVATLASLTCNGEPSIDVSNYALPVPSVVQPYYKSLDYSVYSPVSEASYSPFYNSIGSPISQSNADSVVLSSLSHLDESTKYFYERFYGTEFSYLFSSGRFESTNDSRSLYVPLTSILVIASFFLFCI